MGAGPHVHSLLIFVRPPRASSLGNGKRQRMDRPEETAGIAPHPPLERNYVVILLR